MPGYYVALNNARKGPISREKLAAAIRAGKVPDAAEITDADTGDIVLADDILAEPEAPAGGVDYGRGSAQGVTVHRKKAKQPYGVGKQYAANMRQPVDREPGISTAALVASLLLWPLGLILAIVAMSKCKELGAPNKLAKRALIISIIWGIFAVLQISFWIAKGEI